MYEPRYFKLRETSCHCGCNMHSTDEMVMFADKLREKLGFALQVSSGARCLNNNEDAGGAPDSPHLKGKALDLKPYPPEINTEENRMRIEVTAAQLGAKGIGRYHNRVHIDISHWGKNGIPRVWISNKK